MIRSRRLQHASALSALLCLFCLASACIDIRVQPPTAPTPGPTPPVPTPTPKVLEVRQYTSGRAVVHVDLSGFRASDTIGYYPLFTLLWEAGNVHAPWAEVSIIGTGPEFCTAAPCGDRYALRLRFSGDIAADGAQPDERLHCGEGVNGRKGVPIGPAREFDLEVRWDATGVELRGPAGAWKARRGAPRVGFGVWLEGVPTERPARWGWPAWEARKRGARVALVDWEAVGAQGGLGVCP